MKYALLTFLALVLFTASAVADGPEPGYSAQYYGERPASTRYERQLRRDYERWRREQAELHDYDRYRRSQRSARRAAQERAYAAEERQERRRAAERRERREGLALAEENRRYAAQRRRYAERDLSYADRDYERDSGTSCKPYVTGYGERARIRPRAEGKALRSWAAKVRADYSNSYASWGRARNKAFACDPIEGTWPKIWECRARARPCRAQF